MGKRCGECGRAAARLRKDRCDACYMRQYRGGELPERAACSGCGERRRPVLTLGVVGVERVVLCGNCLLVHERARPKPATVEALRERVTRERRLTGDWRRGRSGLPGLQAGERREGPRRSSERIGARVVPFLDPSID